MLNPNQTNYLKVVLVANDFIFMSMKLLNN